MAVFLASPAVPGLSKCIPIRFYSGTPVQKHNLCRVCHQCHERAPSSPLRSVFLIQQYWRWLFAFHNTGYHGDVISLEAVIGDSPRILLSLEPASREMVLVIGNGGDCRSPLPGIIGERESGAQFDHCRGFSIAGSFSGILDGVLATLMAPCRRCTAR